MAIFADKAASFIEEHFPEATLKIKSSGREYRFVCPFCNGGQSEEISFDFNPDTGACRCWRASCNWRGSAEWFVHNYLDVPYGRAVDILGGSAPTDLEGLNADLELLHKMSQKVSRDFTMFTERTVAWIDNSVPLNKASSEIQMDVYNWIENVRGYDYNKFVKTHELYIPPQIGDFVGRVMFKVSTGEDLGYILYAYDQTLEKKTLNPYGKVLSKLLYRFDEVKNGKTLFICEGIFDAARLASHGFHATCIFGVAISDYQKILLSQTKAKEICLALDAGAEAARDGLYQELVDFFPNRRVSFLNLVEEHFIGSKERWKKGMDPDDLTEEEFLAFYKRRKARATTEEDRLNLQMRELEKSLKNLGT